MKTWPLSADEDCPGDDGHAPAEYPQRFHHRIRYLSRQPSRAPFASMSGSLGARRRATVAMPPEADTALFDLDKTICDIRSAAYMVAGEVDYRVVLLMRQVLRGRGFEPRPSCHSSIF